MVNFQNETTITRPRQDIINFTVLERRQDVLNTYKEYKETVIKRNNYDQRKFAAFQSSLLTLAEEIRAMLIEAIPTDNKKIYKEYKEIVNDIELGNEEQIIKAWHYIDTLLYEKGLTKSDTKEVYDRTDIWGSNRRALS